MNCIAWNCQGIGAPSTVRALGEHLQKWKPQLIFLSETRADERKNDFLKNKFDMFGVGVPVEGKSGGLALLWRKELSVILQSCSKNHIDVVVYDDDNNSNWRFTGFYGHSETHRRKETWDLLRRLKSKSSKPWLVAGDYNEILTHSEMDSLHFKPNWQLNNFRQAIVDAEINDLGYNGYLFTWCNNREKPYTVRERLDRACASSFWIQKYPHHSVHHLNLRGSDHAPILIEFSEHQPAPVAPNKKHFLFEAMWIKAEDCEKVIQNSWYPSIGKENHPNILNYIENCRVGLLSWIQMNFGQVSKQIVELNENLENIRRGPISPESKSQEKSLRIELEELFDREDMMWRLLGENMTR